MLYSICSEHSNAHWPLRNCHFCRIIKTLYSSHSKQVSKLAKWYIKDISPPSVSNNINPSGYTKPEGDTSYCYVSITFRVTGLPNVITAVSGIGESAVLCVVGVNRNW
jgi:hypothetical protein